MGKATPQGRGSTCPVAMKEQFCRKDLKLEVANTGLIEHNFQELKCQNKNVLEKYFVSADSSKDMIETENDKYQNAKTLSLSFFIPIRHRA